VKNEIEDDQRPKTMAKKKQYIVGAIADISDHFSQIRSELLPATNGATLAGRAAVPSKIK